MDISIYEIIQLPLLSEKAQRVNHDLGKLVLEVHPHANKILIKQALKKLFNVEAAHVCVQVRKGKNKSVSRSRLTTRDAHRKIAYITLKKGYKLDLFGHGEGASVTQSEKAENKNE